MKNKEYKHQNISFTGALKFAWGIFKQYPVLFMMIMLTYFISWVILEVVVILGHNFGFLWWVIAHSAFCYIFSGLIGGNIAICIVLNRGESASYSRLFSKMTLAPAIFVSSISSFCIIIMGLFAFLVPGFYAGGRFLFLNYCLVGENLSLSQSFRASFARTNDNQGFLLRVFASLLIFNIIGASVLGIGLLFTVPISMLTVSYLYNEALAYPDQLSNAIL